ncbi:MAG: AzlD domain-containing protein [Actinomycetota bacterium]|nr:AzlD domain-containing protein [Actinomycetota bacterium]
MPWSSYLLIFAICVGTIIVFRVAPMFMLAGRDLPEPVAVMLGYIPVCAFAALVANDLFKPESFSAGPWAVLIPYLASIPVIVIARKTRSLALCIVVGVAAYALLLFAGRFLV